ncbi:hypothetical protein SteCoe_13613 [Stentor coeruleus]|uniref:Peptidase M14 domain-containing protein n=1 Tax=Stentor coeruleus TaxID=5963 RepID=A0A1R2C815_9CILI|nr:hypothetical protein SteCoe_13613 [Stentor coeruleus]
MKIFLLLLLLFLVKGHIKLGSLDGYLTYSEILSTISNLASLYPSLLTQFSYGIFDRLILQNASIHSEYIKPLVLVLGGFYGGYPQAAIQVLEIAEELASKSILGEHLESFIVNTYEIHFIPILNQKAYKYMEEHYMHESFPVVKTGLENYQMNCSGYDNGINPNHNFPKEFQIIDDKCSEDYSGEFPLESEIAREFIRVYYSSGHNPELAFSYQGTGNMYKIPFASYNNTGNQIFKMLTENVKYLIPDGYDLIKAFDLNEIPEYGTYLDYGTANSTDVFEIALGSIARLDENLIIPEAVENYNTFVSILNIIYPNITFEFVNVLEFVKTEDDNSEPYSDIEFKLIITNNNYLRYYHHVNFNPGFKLIDNYQVKYIVCTLVPKYIQSGSVYFMQYSDLSISNASIIDFNNEVPGYASLYYVITYKRLNKHSDRHYDFKAVLSSSEFYVEDIVVTGKGEIELSDNTKNKNDKNIPQEKAVFVSFILLITLVALVFVAGVVIYYTRRKNDYKQKLSQNEDIESK